MKTLFAIVLLLIVSTSTAFAAAELPKSSVWFDPAAAAVGESVTLNALVYNDQTADATVTVVFSDTTGTIGTTSALIAKATAKTLSVSWKMPEKNTVVTAKVTTATDAAKKSVPGLIGVLGTVTVGPTVAPTPTVAGISFPGSAQINAWFAPLLSKVEAFRIKQTASFTTLKSTTQARIDHASALASNPAPDDKNVASEAAGNPFDYVTLAYATVALGIFSSQAIFYVAIVLIFLLALRFIVNLFF
jgi:hypothetical protein